MAERPGILAVDRNPRNLQLLAQLLDRQGYRLQGASSLDELDQALCDGVGLPHLALVDIAGFDPSIWQRCDQLSARGVPLLVVAPPNRPALERESRAHGARGVLVKPLATHLLVGSIRSLVGDKLQEL
jgi:CheY-like chemotaxis protein